MGLEGAVADTAELELPVLYAPTAIHYFGYFGFHCTPLIHWTHHSSIVGGGVKW